MTNLQLVPKSTHARGAPGLSQPSFLGITYPTHDTWVRSLGLQLRSVVKIRIADAWAHPARYAMSKTQPKPSILIIGAGELGAATGVSLVRSGRYGKVTIIDRAQILPAIDAASCDYNKVVRMDYMDDVYATLAKQSIDEWRKPEWKGIFHE